MFYSLIHTVKDILFPKYCISCKKEGFWLCADCYAAIDWEPVLACPLCHRDNTNGGWCDTCTPTFLDSHIACARYTSGAVVAQLIELLKYNYVEEVTALFSTPIHALAQKKMIMADIVVPIPLHKKRYAERGFNQAASIAALVAEASDVPLVYALRRIRPTKQQATLTKQERHSNVADAFDIRPDVDVRGESVLLVDDVYTTGCTMQACALVLHNAGATCVKGFTLARGE